MTEFILLSTNKHYTGILAHPLDSKLHLPFKLHSRGQKFEVAKVLWSECIQRSDKFPCPLERSFQEQKASLTKNF